MNNNFNKGKSPLEMANDRIKELEEQLESAFQVGVFQGSEDYKDKIKILKAKIALLETGKTETLGERWLKNKDNK